jgi:hypothetical protein
MTSHFKFKDSKWLISIHYFVNSMFSTGMLYMWYDNQGVSPYKNFVPMTNHFKFRDPTWLINIHYFVNLMFNIGMKVLALQMDLHTSHYQPIDLGNENEFWEHHFIGATPSLQQSVQWKTTCISVIIKLLVLHEIFVPMINHLLKDSKWLINIHYFVDLMFSTIMKILVQLLCQQGVNP